MTAHPMGSDTTGESPVDRLAELIDALDEHVQTAELRVRRSEGNRISILYVHAIYALLIAPAFAAIGEEGMKGQIWTVMRMVPGAPYSVALIMFLGGFILAVSTTLASREWELVGLGLLIVWYGMVSVSFAGSIIIWLAGPELGPPPSFYAPLVYAHFLTIMLVHTYTLRRMIRASRLRKLIVERRGR